MARFLSVTPTYNPFTMDEMLKIPLLYDAAYKNEESRFDKLTEDAASYELYARAYPNSEASKQYLNYINELDEAFEDFYKNGLSNSNKTTLSNLRRSYNKAVKPFKRAVSTYNAILTQRQKDYEKDIIGNDIDLDYILQHPEYTADVDKNSYTTGNEVYNEAKRIFKGLTGYDTTPKTALLSDGTYARYVPKGYTSEDFKTALFNEGNGVVTPELQQIVTLFKQQSGFNSLTEEQQQKWLYYAYQGAAQNAKDPSVTSGFIPKNIRTASNEYTVNPSNGTANTGREYYSRDLPKLGYDKSYYEDQNGERVYKKDSKYFHIKESDGKLMAIPITEPIVINEIPYRPTQSKDGSLEAITNEYYNNATVPVIASSGNFEEKTLGKYNQKRGLPYSTNSDEYQEVPLSSVVNMNIDIPGIKDGTILIKNLQKEAAARLKNIGYADKDIKNLDLRKYIVLRIQQDSKNRVVGYSYDIKNPDYIKPKQNYKDAAKLDAAVFNY